MSHNVAGSGERNKQPGLWNVAREQRLAPSNKFTNEGPNQAALPTTMCNRGHLIKACLHLHPHLSLQKQQYTVLVILQCICPGEF